MSTQFAPPFRLADETRPGAPSWGLPWELSAELRRKTVYPRLGLRR